jgi:HEAT repeat protein
VRALGRLQDPESEAALDRVADSDADPLVRRAAAGVLDELRPERGDGPT